MVSLPSSFVDGRAPSCLSKAELVLCNGPLGSIVIVDLATIEAAGTTPKVVPTPMRAVSAVALGGSKLGSSWSVEVELGSVTAAQPSVLDGLANSYQTASFSNRTLGSRLVARRAPVRGSRTAKVAKRGGDPGRLLPFTTRGVARPCLALTGL